MEIQYLSRIIATMQFKAEGQVSASRGFDHVTLHVPFRVALEPEATGPTWIGDRIEADLFGKGSGGTERLVAHGRANSVLEPRATRYEPEVFIDFRCSPRAIAEYEQARDGGPVDLRIHVTIPFHELEPGTAHRRILGQTQYLRAQDSFRIDIAQWNKALRSVGMTASVVVEIPFPLASEPEDEALRALSDAFASFENGGSTAWKAVVGDIRPYLEKWVKAEPLPAKAPKDGSAADRKWKLLNLRDALYKCCHFGVHESASETGRSDALLALSTFAALLKALRSS